MTPHPSPLRVTPSPTGEGFFVTSHEKWVVEAPTPTDVKGKTEEILLTIVGEDIILPPKTTAN